jgi:hypothetical protein
VITVGLLHTSAAHVPTFEALLRRSGAAVAARHVVDEGLLAEAGAAGGVGPALRARIAGRLAEAAAGATAVLCTCSTIGAVAEELSDRVGVPVLRADRPMAAAAVRAAAGRGGGVIGVVATARSTLGPTEALLREVATAAGVRMIAEPAEGGEPIEARPGALGGPGAGVDSGAPVVRVRMSLCAGAWELFGRGDFDGYRTAVADHLLRVEPAVDVFVLAQASMAGAAEERRLSVPVFSAPRPAVAELIRIAEAVGS